MKALCDDPVITPNLSWQTAAEPALWEVIISFKEDIAATREYLSNFDSRLPQWRQTVKSRKSQVGRLVKEEILRQREQNEMLYGFNKTDPYEGQ